ncbi:hypothetical protein V8E52_006427 [Russula decolorans]
MYKLNLLAVVLLMFGLSASAAAPRALKQAKVLRGDEPHKARGSYPSELKWITGDRSQIRPPARTLKNLSVGVKKVGAGAVDRLNISRERKDWLWLATKSRGRPARLGNNIMQKVLVLFVNSAQLSSAQLHRNRQREASDHKAEETSRLCAWPSPRPTHGKLNLCSSGGVDDSAGERRLGADREKYALSLVRVTRSYTVAASFHGTAGGTSGPIVRSYHWYRSVTAGAVCMLADDLRERTTNNVECPIKDNGICHLKEATRFLVN